VGDENPADVVARLQADPRVAAVQLDHVRHAFAWTDDPLLEEGWPYVDLVRLPRAWDASTGAGVTIAVLDTGVSAHPDLVLASGGKDFVDNDADPSDPNGHGTLVAGVAAARGNNGAGSVGAAYDAKILPVRVLDADGNGNDSTIAAGLAWATSHGASVINLSLGGTDPSPVLRDAIATAVAAGAVVIAAAGNDGTQEAQYPAAYAPQIEGLLAVAATNDDGQTTAFSSFGDWVSISAPGYQIIGPSNRGGYVYDSGTSFSAPFVAGVAALLRARPGVLSPAVVERRLIAGARDAGPRGVDPYYGAGVLDAATALTSADALPAAVAPPLDRAPVDPGASDDTRATAMVLTAAGATGMLSPEGDEDWYAYDAPARGWYSVEVPGANGYSGRDLDPVVEVRDGEGRVLATGRDLSTYGEVDVTVGAPHAMRLYIRVTNRNGSASDVDYRVSVRSSSTDRFTATATGTSGSSWGFSSSLGLADVTGDGVVDALRVSGGRYLLLNRGVGDGSFEHVELVGLSNSDSGGGFVAADLDGDGQTDLAVGSVAGIAFFDTGTGGIVPTGTLPMSTSAAVMAGGDIDGDGDVDLVVGREASDVVQVLLNDGGGGFTPGASATRPEPRRVTLGDVNADHRPDLVWPTGVSLQNPDGTFAPAIPLPALQMMDGDQPDVAVADVTGDGVPDVVRNSRVGSAVQVDSWSGAGFGPSALYPTAFNAMPYTVAVADFDLDGRQDVVAAGFGVLSYFPQTSAGTLGAAEVSVLRSSGSLANGALAVADLDADGAPDAALSIADGVIAMHQNALDAVHRSPIAASAVSPAPNTAGADVRQATTISFERDMSAASATPATVRLVDGATQADIPSTMTWTSARTLTITPTSDLGVGNHYTVIVDGLQDAAGATQRTPVRTWFTVGANGERYTPVDPVRVLDTRSGLGLLNSGPGPRQPGVPLQLQILSLPADATAVVLNVTASNPSAPGNIRVYPTGPGAPPRVSNLNVMPGVDQPNLVTVALGTDRSVTLLPEATTTHLIADVAGYYSAGAATAFEPLTPRRVMDMRNGTGVRKGALKAGQWVDLSVADGTLVPKDATAVVLNVTGTQVTGPTHVRVYPTPGAGEDQTPPDISNLNLLPGRDQPNLVTVKVGDGGRVRFFTPIASELLIADVAGYYTATGDNGFVPISPVRIGDTRSTNGFTGKLTAGTAQDLAVTGHAGVPSNAVAAVLNVTGVHPSLPTHVRAYPTAPGNPPDVSTINLVPGRDDANLALVKLGTGGTVSFFTPVGTTDLVVDVSGYFRR
ncbi:S8 family serine peptidase, partial [Cellulomonas sp. P5_C6]